MRIIKKNNQQPKSLWVWAGKLCSPSNPGSSSEFVKRRTRRGGPTNFRLDLLGLFLVVKQVKSGENVSETTYLVEDPPWKKNCEEVPSI